MKAQKFFLTVLLMIFPSTQAQACDRNLTGTWKSDKNRSMLFNKANAKLQAKTERFLDELLGHMTMTFDAGELHATLPDLKVSIAGELRPFVGFQERKPYKILFCSADTVVWSAKRHFGDEDVATTSNFEGPDTFWLYNGTSAQGVPDLHTREYFQRVR